MANNEYPVTNEPYIIEQVPVNEANTLGTSLLDSSVLVQDKIFEGIVKSISPEVITAENKELIDSFVDILTEASPISINIIDFFSKNPNVASIDQIQDELAQMYLNNFHYVWNKAKNDYNLKNKLENLLKQYRKLTGSIDEGDFNFFGNEDELYTTERYILAKEFKQKKGTATAIEYAYRVGWLANIEGPLRTEYDFNITHESCKGFDEGFYVCNEVIPTPYSHPCIYNSDMYPPLSPTINPDTGAVEPGSVDPGRVPSNGTTDGYSKHINTFMISDSVEENPCFPFRYIVEGSMIPDFFEAFVIPLAHPVGFSYIYTKLFKTAWIDYFNVELIYRADEVYVSTLCPDEDCNLSAAKTLYGAPLPTLSVTKSQWRTFEEGKLHYGQFKDTRFEKYTFENTSYLIQYTKGGDLEATERTIHYFNVPEIRSKNLIQNGDFNNRTSWKINSVVDNNGDEIPSAWSIGNSKAISTNAVPGQKLSQDMVLEANKNYLIELKTDGISFENPVYVSFGVWELFQESINGAGEVVYKSFNPKKYEEPFKFQLTENILYDFDYVARGGETLSFYTESSNQFTYSINDVLVVKNEPTTVYSVGTHSIIGLINPAPPLPILYTHDLWRDNQGMHYFPTDNMNELFINASAGSDFDAKVGPLKDPGSPLNDFKNNWSGEIQWDGITLGEEDGESWDSAKHSGNMIINEFHYGQSKYKTTGEEQIIQGGFIKGDTVDYVVPSSHIIDDGINPIKLADYGELNTRYIFLLHNVFNTTDLDYTKDKRKADNGETAFIPLDYLIGYTYIDGVGKQIIKRVYKSLLRRDNEEEGNIVPPELNNRLAAINLYQEDFTDNAKWEDVEADITYTKHNAIDDGMLADVEIGTILSYSYLIGNNTTNNITYGAKYKSLTDRTTVHLFNEDFTDENFWELHETDINKTDFKDINYWKVFLSNIDPDQEVGSVTNEGGFVIGGKIIPWGDPDTAYMREDVEIERNNPEIWQNAFFADSQNFSNPLKWEQNGLGADWDIIESGQNGSSNYANCDYQYGIDYSWTHNEQSGNYTLIDFSINPPLDPVINPPIIDIFAGDTITYTLYDGNDVQIYDKQDFVALVDLPAQNMTLIDVSSSNWIEYHNGRRDVSLIQRDLDIFPPVGENALIKVIFNVEFDKTKNVNQNSHLDFTLGIKADYTYTVYTNLVKPSYIIPNLLIGQTVDNIVIDVDDEFNLFQNRYKSLTNRTNVNLKDETFTDLSKWEPVETNGIFRYQKSQTGEWMGFYKPGDKFIFGASTNFKGKITSFSAEWLNTPDIYEIHIIEDEANINPVEDVKINDIVNRYFTDLNNIETLKTYKSLTTIGLIGLSDLDYTNTDLWELIF